MPTRKIIAHNELKILIKLIVFLRSLNLKISKRKGMKEKKKKKERVKEGREGRREKEKNKSNVKMRKQFVLNFLNHLGLKFSNSLKATGN